MLGEGHVGCRIEGEGTTREMEKEPGICSDISM